MAKARVDGVCIAEDEEVVEDIVRETVDSGGVRVHH